VVQILDHLQPNRVHQILEPLGVVVHPGHHLGIPDDVLRMLVTLGRQVLLHHLPQDLWIVDDHAGTFEVALGV
jgi:hypothetical protein